MKKFQSVEIIERRVQRRVAREQAARDLTILQTMNEANRLIAEGRLAIEFSSTHQGMVEEVRCLYLHGRTWYANVLLINEDGDPVMPMTHCLDDEDVSQVIALIGDGDEPSAALMQALAASFYTVTQVARVEVGGLMK